ncbi:hypothetical protein CBS101457_002980 [Exobasidium rhododendri]|nr:hypothetical protein CBS101457_002980 [Exobasidium rhododendri]
MSLKPKKIKPTHYALSSRLLKDKKWPRPIGPLVDTYLSNQIKHLMPHGGYDVPSLSGDSIILRVSKNELPFQPLGVAKDDEGRMETTKPTEVLYLDQSGDASATLTRYWNHLDAELTKIVDDAEDEGHSTHDMVLFIESVDGSDEGRHRLQEAANDLEEAYRLVYSPTAILHSYSNTTTSDDAKGFESVAGAANSATKCTNTSAGQRKCQRCERFDFECNYRSSKRGRRPKSKAGQAHITPASKVRLGTESTVDHSLDIFKTAGVREKAWRILTRKSANRGSTYNFVTSGKAEVSTLKESQSSSARESRKTSHPSLRDLLRRVDMEDTPSAVVGEAVPLLPRMIFLDAPRDPRQVGIVSEERAQQLFDYFNGKLSPWIAALDPTIAISAIATPFLLSAILLQASRYIGGRDSTESMALAIHCRTVGALAFLEADTSQEVALAFYILSTWKMADDSFSDMYTGFADRIEMMNGGIQTAEEADERSQERIQLFHYVQHNVFTLHYSPSPTFRKRNDLTRQALTWAQAQNSLVGDWFLCSDMESTAIQIRYKSLFEEQQHQHGATYIPLLETFLHEMSEWESRWRQESARREALELGDATGRLLRGTGLKLFRNSVCIQISSIALCETLRTWLRGKQLGTSVYTKRSFDICLDSCIGLLESILDLDGEGETLLHMPDSLVLLADHASLLIVYLLLLPSTTAERGDHTALMHTTSIDQVEDSLALECVEKIRRVSELMRSASLLRGDLSTAVGLSADYLDSIIDLIEGRNDVINNHDEVIVSALQSTTSIFVRKGRASYCG